MAGNISYFKSLDEFDGSTITFGNNEKNKSYGKDTMGTFSFALMMHFMSMV